MSLTESIVEDAALTWFGGLGYSCLGVQALTSTLSQGERESYGEVVLVGWRRETLRQIRPKIPDEAREEALRNVLRLDFPSLLSANSKQARTLGTLREALLPKLLGEALSVAERREKSIKSHKVSETVQAYLH